MKILNIKLDKLSLDPKNPRLSEFNVTEQSTEQEILTILWEAMAVNELMYSIISNGFWEYEPLIIIKSNDRYIVIEGNRRLAAVKLIHEQGNINIPTHLIDKISTALIKETEYLPTIEVKSREDAWRYVGFKHVNGPAKWGSFAKAKYIAEIHNNYKVPISEISYRIGDTNNIAQKLYQGLMVLEQAEQAKIYSYDDIQASRIYFSHLYNGIQREGIRVFLDLANAKDESFTPVPKEKLKNLGQLLVWLYGSKRDNIQPIITSQNPDLKRLDEVLKNKEAYAALNAGEPLSYAYELSRSYDALFEQNLLDAKRGLLKARAYLTTGYKGEQELLRIAGSVAELADDLYEEMDKVNKAQNRNRNRKNKRITEAG